MNSENQRRPDRGNGYYLNPILGGDYPDPSVLRVGDDYYMVHSSFNYAPGLLIWHSRDLVNWQPLTYALAQYDGDVWAPELIQHNGTFHIYYKTSGGNHVVTSTRIEGTWGEPVNLKIGYIDPGHLATPDGRRFLYLSDGRMTELAPDGLSTKGELQRVYDGWPIPDEWRIEGVCLEGPKMLAKDGFYYMITAEGGTAGPATSHMVIVARSRDPYGPWENCPHNPILRTQSRTERWWSLGHATIVDTPHGDWWMMLHAYENGYYTLGRQTLLVPIEWTDDGWPRVPEGIRIDEPLRKPQGKPCRTGLALSDDFSGAEFGLQWRLWGDNRAGRYKVADKALSLQAEGASPADSAPLCCIPVDRAYEVEVDVTLQDAQSEAGLLLFYNPQCYTGIALSPQGLKLIHRTYDQVIVPRAELETAGGRARLRIVNDHHEVDFWYQLGDGDWRKATASSEVSGFHHNVFGGFLSLRVGLYAAGNGTVQFRGFTYRGRDNKD
jgi:beta-xylosidase